MKFFGNKKTADDNRRQHERRQPNEEVRVSDNISISVWSAKRSDGRVRSDFKLNRVNPETGDVYKTFRPRDLAFEFPLALGLLCSSYSKKKDEPLEVRTRLEQMALALEKFASAPQEGNGVDEDNSDNETRILNI